MRSTQRITRTMLARLCCIIGLVAGLTVPAGAETQYRPASGMECTQWVQAWIPTPHIVEGTEVTICEDGSAWLVAFVDKDIDQWIESPPMTEWQDFEWESFRFYWVAGELTYDDTFGGSSSGRGFGFGVPGDHTVTCTVFDDMNTPASDPSVTLEWTIHVRPSDPPPIEDSICDTDGGCGGCGGGDGLPMPSLFGPEVDVGFSPPGVGGGPGAPGGSYGPGTGCKKCTYDITERCDAYYIRFWDGNGVCTRYGPFESDDDINLVINGIVFSGHVDSLLALTMTVTYPDGSTHTYSSHHSFDDRMLYKLPYTGISDAQGNDYAFAYDTTNGAVESVSTPGGFTWNYQHTDSNFPTQITRATAPDGSYTDVTYTASGPAAGKIASVTVPNSAGEPSVTDYSYKYWDSNTSQWIDDTSGRLRSATRSTRTMTYDYPDSETVVVKETHRNLDGSGNFVSEDVYSETEYDYTDTDQETDISTTKITRKHPTDSSKNQATTTHYYISGAKKYQIQKVVNHNDTSNPNDDTTTTYEYEEVTESAQRTYARLLRVTDDSGCYTEYDYVDYTGTGDMKWVPPVSAVVRYDASDNELSREEYTYYYDESVTPTAPRWLKTTKDVRGNYTYYERDLQNHPELVRSIKVSAPVGGQEPNWSNVAAIKEFTYYDGAGQDGLPGQLKQEIVPGIDTTTTPATDQVTEYKYKQGDRYFTSPTATIYQYPGESGYTTKTSYAYYDELGRTVYTSDASGSSIATGRKVWYTYDALGRQLKTIYAWSTPPTSDDQPETGTPSIYTENNYGCCTLNWSMDEEGNTTYYKYDDANRVKKVWTDISGQVESTPLVEYTYDAFGNKATVVTRSDANTTRTTSYTYDKNDRVTKIVYPTVGGNRALDDEYFQYDSRGNLVAKLVGVVNDQNDTITSGVITAYEYDDLGRLKYVDENYSYTAGTTVWPLQSISVTADVTYTYYGGSSLRHTMEDSSGTSSYEYDIQGRLTKYTPPVGLDTGYYVAYDYNNLGQKIYEKITNGTTTNYDCRYEYYANGWLWKVKDGGAALATYSYDAVGNRTQVDNGNTTYTTYAYDSDPRYRLNTITHKKGANTLATIDYTAVARDKVGNPKSMTTTWNDRSLEWTYDYDENNRLISAVPPTPVPDQPAGGVYGYDWVGNRVRPPADPNPPSHTNEMVYNAVDQLTSWPGMRSYTYYPDGSLHEENAIINGQATQIGHYTYHYSGLLDVATYATPGGNHTATNTWDADANRVQLVINGQTFKFVYDPTAGIPAVIEEQKTGGTTVYYYREPNGALIARYDAASEETRYYHFDALGSTRLLTDGRTGDNLGNVTDKYSYDAWGSLIWHEKLTGSVEQPYQYVGQLGYYTHYQDPDFKLLQLGVRFYDTEIGRFTQRDPLADVAYIYAYAGDRPAIVHDPTGLWPGWKPVPIAYAPGGACVMLAAGLCVYGGSLPSQCVLCCAEMQLYWQAHLPLHFGPAIRAWATTCATLCSTTTGYLPWKNQLKQWRWW